MNLDYSPVLGDGATGRRACRVIETTARVLPSVRSNPEPSG
jgi:hypothetical protein